MPIVNTSVRLEIDHRIALKIGDLIRDIAKTPFSGLGKPEAFFNPHIRSSASLRKSPQRHLCDTSLAAATYTPFNL